MKITKFLVLSFFLFALTTASFPNVLHAKESEPVLDVSNQKVHAGYRYFIEVAKPDEHNIGGLVVGEPTNGTCPRDVILSTTRYMHPVTFSPSEISDSPVIRENTHVTVKFSIRYMCRALLSLVWRVGKDASSGQFIVTLGGTAGLDRFKITKFGADGHDNWYRLSYCPLVEDLFCVEIGYVVIDGVKYLAPQGKPFPIVFRRANVEPKIDYIKMIT